ncbi:hypothetical protein EMPS_09894 [Entomortierella parvispora]|uniref:Uncharacterized protein n=1 Tax=Entomortierella parvispora TaxID=205924 RepID=A0A9P3HIW2_9FUNG|nr:hypothetical protein EMPS_09894 [Entomortierella parvispora]
MHILIQHSRNEDRTRPYHRLACSRTLLPGRHTSYWTLSFVVLFVEQWHLTGRSSGVRQAGAVASDRQEQWRDAPHAEVWILRIVDQSVQPHLLA